MVTYLECLTTKLKIIALTETWLKDHHTNYTLPNYNFEQTFRPKARGGGVCLYIHSSLQYKMRRDLIPTNQNIIKNSKHHHQEVNSLFIEIDKKSTLTKHNIIVGCIDLLVTHYIILMSYLEKYYTNWKVKRNMITLQEISIAIH